MGKAIKYNSLNNYTGSAIYQITVQGILDEEGLQEMTGMSISYSGDPRISTLTGKVEDQSALNGLINTLYNQRLTVVSIVKISN
jgi:hypothetical protein